MDLRQLSDKAIEIQQKYRQLNQEKGERPWTTAEYLQGLVGDIGDLTKLIMAKNNFRRIENADQKLAHELSDCLWSILILAHELDLDLEQSFLTSMDELQTRVIQEIGQ